MGELTRQQKEAIAWADVVAGLMTAESGFVSLFIAAAASMAYYKDKVANEGWKTIITEEPVLPSNSNNYGILHNLTCEKYLTDGYDQVTYNEILITAVKVRPDLASEIYAIAQDYFQEKVEMAIQKNLVSVDDKVNAILDAVPLKGVDIDKVYQLLTVIDNTDDDDDWQTNVQNLIQLVPSFNLNDNDKNVLINSFEILKNSYQLWSK
ncbi:hypothetical protein [Chryseobacterium sp.]|uniref:hypothetical protein n=1 Tax=Chryseobacterium sp. TaxID=1871047 RepID=UPI001B2944C2|nr:hypothetical protein [Chryseobacterium sp.]MBO9691031.1 hypothetical protein [Chryseobacterium sp.]